MTDPYDTLRKYMGPLSQFRKEGKTKLNMLENLLQAYAIEYMSSFGDGGSARLDELKKEILTMYLLVEEERHEAQAYAEDKLKEAETWRARYTAQELKHKKSEEVLDDYIDNEYENE